ncbi:MAG: ABC transporter permease [Deltaproteobacteria bacterium]|nr:ABC transporter permease [Deltaproteobacteria bacterium]
MAGLGRSPAAAVFRKEVVDNMRDRRTLAAALFYPLLGPLLVVLLLAVVGRSVSEQSETPLKLPVVGAENAPNLVAFLKQHNVEVLPAVEDPEGAVKAGDAEVVLVIPMAYGEDFVEGRPATVRLVMDDSRQSSAVSIGRARGLLETYSRTTGALRLLARGISPQITSALAVEQVNTATPQSQAARFLSIAPYMIIFSIFIGGMYLAIDTTAGERERGSLEPLLINPASRRQIVLGKYGATLVFTFIAVAETLLGFAVVLNYIPLEAYLGVRYSLSGGALLAIFLITIPMMLLAAALQIIIATFTRSFKEAQNYLSLLPLVPALPGMFLAFLPVKIKLWMMAIPTFGQQLLILRFMRGETVDPLHLMVSTGVTALVAVVLFLLAARLYERESVVLKS